jgi:predicted enzyme related to lactoylglutathione lyase
MLRKYKLFIFTEDPDTLVKFYTDALGMNIVRKLEYDLDYGYTLELHEGGPQVWLAKHSQVKGISKEPFRIMMNIYVDSVTKYYEKAIAYEGVTEVAEPFSMGEIIPGEERYAATILDPEGNALQFMGELG